MRSFFRGLISSKCFFFSKPHRLKTDGCQNSNPLKGFRTVRNSPFSGLDFDIAAGFEPAAAQNMLSPQRCPFIRRMHWEKGGELQLSRFLLFIAPIFLILLLAQPTHAQVGSDGHPLQVFIQRNIDSAGADRLHFVDSLTGESTPLEVNGTRYTLVQRSVMFFDAIANQVMLASPNGDITPHPFIEPNEQTRRIDWLLSPDGIKIAWTLSDSDSENMLTTTTMIADLDGENSREILVDGPRDGIRALPIAFSADNRLLYMDYQPNAIADVTPFQQYAGIFSVDLESNQVVMLPGEPGCFCGAGIGAGMFLRLKLASDLNGFDVVVTDLAGQVGKTIPAIRLVNFTQAGDVLISPDGKRAVYGLAQVRNFGGPNEVVQTVFVLVNLTDVTQTALTSPINQFLQPVAWTETNTAVIFTSPQVDGTWKINLNDGRLNRIASATYLGTLN
jgi:hypothetical protein